MDGEYSNKEDYDGEKGYTPELFILSKTMRSNGNMYRVDFLPINCSENGSSNKPLLDELYCNRFEVLLEGIVSDVDGKARILELVAELRRQGKI